jgi:uncharacterized membrane protein
MPKENKAKSKTILFIFLFIMAAMVFFGILFYAELKMLFDRPTLYPHVLFLHILSVTLFFANAVVGILWEARSLASGRKEIILHTYDTVAYLDARFSSPLIILSVITGVTLTLMTGDIWEIGWLFTAFALFLFSGAVWIISDIPTQYKIKSQMADIDPQSTGIPDELMRLLKMRLWISLAGVLPLVIVFILMVYKPYIPPVLEWFG